MIAGGVADRVASVGENGLAAGCSEDDTNSGERALDQLGQNQCLTGGNEFWFIALQLDQANVEFQVGSCFAG